MFTLRINQNCYPMVTATVEWNDGGWRTSILPRVTPEVADEIDRNHAPDMEGFIVDCIYYAMVDGWASNGRLYDEDEEYGPLDWQIEHNGKPIQRNDLEALLNGEVVSTCWWA